MTMGHKARWVRIGKQTDRVTAAASLVDVAVPADGDQLGGTESVESLDTDHGNLGVLYSQLNARNDSPQSFRTYAYPNIIGTVLDNLFNRDASNNQDFLTVEHWWGTAIAASGQARGLRAYGVVMDSVSLSIDLTGQGQSLELDLQAFLNREKVITDAESVPAKAFTTLLPFSTTGVRVDFRADLAVDTAWTKHNSDVRRLTFSYGNGGSVEGFQDNATDPEMDKTWTIHSPGEQSLEVEVTVALSDDKYLALNQQSPLPDGGMRIAITHANGDSVATAGSIAAGDNDIQQLLSGDTKGITAGDVTLIEEDATGNFTVLPVDAVVSDVSIDYDTDTGGGTGFDARLALTGPLTIRNIAGIIVLPKLGYRSKSKPTRDQNKTVVTIRYEAELGAGEASIAETHFYDHVIGHA